MADAPTNIRAHQAEQILELAWEDDKVDRLPYHYLRAECPCASCRDEWTGERTLDPKTIRPDPEARRHGAGSAICYAVHASAWNDGLLLRGSIPGRRCATARPGDGRPDGLCLHRIDPPRLRQRASQISSGVGARLVADRPQMTVAIPTCNGGRHLADALLGILVQPGTDWELVIADDRSTTTKLWGSSPVLARNRARVEVNSQRLDLAGNWNRCLALARAPLVAIFHQDDVMLPGHLAAHLAAFRADPRLGLVASAADLFDASGQPLPNTGRSSATTDLARPTCTFPGRPAARARRGQPAPAVLGRHHQEKCRGRWLRPDLPLYALDWDFWVRIARDRPRRVARPTHRRRPLAPRQARPISFKTGTTDLDEQLRLLADLYERGCRLAQRPPTPPRRRPTPRPGFPQPRRHELLKSGDPNLARQCLKQALSLSPGVRATIAGDPRLAVQITALALSPGAAGRLFMRSQVRP